MPRKPTRGRSEWWTSGLPGIEEAEPWQGWTMDNQSAMAGYVTR
jgi:hypothetical protein